MRFLYGAPHWIDRPILKKEIPYILRGDYRDQSVVKLDLVIRLRSSDIRHNFQPIVHFSDGFKINPFTVLCGQFKDGQYQERGETYRALKKRKSNILVKLPQEKIPKEFLNQNLDGEYFLRESRGRFFLYRLGSKPPI